MIESEESIRSRVLQITQDVDCGILTQPMEAQVALNEICRFILGDDWYVVMPLSQEQVNTEIVYAVEMKLRRCLWARIAARRNSRKAGRD